MFLLTYCQQAHGLETCASRNVTSMSEEVYNQLLPAIVEVHVTHAMAVGGAGTDFQVPGQGC